MHRFIDPEVDFVETATCTGLRVGDYEEGDRSVIGLIDRFSMSKPGHYITFVCCEIVEWEVGNLTTIFIRIFSREPCIDFEVWTEQLL